jgi:hypothetical protein
MDFANLTGNITTPTYFVIGMLKEAKALHSKLQFVSGGELSLAYCSSSISDLRRKILEWFMFLKPWMMMYPNLHLAGTNYNSNLNEEIY